MAEGEDKTLIEDQHKEEIAPKAPSGGSKKFLLFGIIGICAIVIGVALAMFVVRPMMSKSSGTEETTEKQAESHDEGHEAKAGGEHGATGSSVYTIKDIVVNPASTGGTRFLSVSFAFELRSPALSAEFESRELAIRDALITILSAKTVAQLTDPKEKEIVRYQIRKRISDILKTDQLAQVYYTDFVLQ